MGTGLNVLLSVAESKQHALSIQYTALEPYPLPLSLASELNYAKSGKLEAYQKLFNDIHTDDWCTPVMLYPGFVFKKLKSTIQEMVLQNNCFQLVYFDAFSPAVQPEMWTSAVFAKIFTAMVSAGILVTYCAKGSVKKLLKEAGFRVESLQGPPGKREITRAIKP
jgi:tRNA U34 5-methylaminomethyl-2-thiouridine-forming methyltransferase MnmC